MIQPDEHEVLINHVKNKVLAILRSDLLEFFWSYCNYIYIATHLTVLHVCLITVCTFVIALFDLA